MPKIERLEWLAPLSEGRGVTLSNDPEADLLLAEDPNALLLGVLLDSQFATRQAFASPHRLRQRLGHLDLAVIASLDGEEFREAFSRKPALHRFPRKFAELTQNFALVMVERYDGDARRVWSESTDAGHLGARLLALPSFGVEKTRWTVRMLGTLGWLEYGGWEEYEPPAPRKPRRAPAIE